MSQFNIAALTAGLVLSLAGAPPATAAPAAAGTLDHAHGGPASGCRPPPSFIDLTHAFGPSTPHWKGFAPETVTTLFTIAKDGFHAENFCHPGQWGTHVDPPAHFHEGLKTVDQIDPRQFLLRLVVLDVHEKVARNPDYVVTLDDVKAWESRHGAIPAGALG